MKLKMHRPARVMNRIGASLIDMFLNLGYVWCSSSCYDWKL